MNTERTAIKVLSITAVILSAALFFVPRRSAAEVTIKDGDYMVCTYPSQAGGGSDALYVADGRSGMLCVFIYDTASRTLVPSAMRRLEEGFSPRGR